MGRIDDVINVAGHRLSTGAMEEVIPNILMLPNVRLLVQRIASKDNCPLFVVLKEGVKKSKEQITSELAQMVRDQIGAVACYKTTLVVQRLPKTRSGKILRGTMRKIADNKPFAIPSTIDDPSILDEIKDALTTISIS
jgi:propionyl-CoA synthetase